MTIMVEVHESRKNAGCWKTAALCCYVVGGIGAVIASVTVGKSSAYFGQKCPLYAQLEFVVSGNSTNKPHEIRVGDDSARWSPMSACDASTYVPVAVAAYAFIMAYFIMMCDRVEKVSSGSGSRNRMLGLFFPLLISSTILSILMVVASVRTSNGTDVFCQALLSSASVQCADAHQYDWPDYPDAKYVYVMLMTAVICSWVSAVGCMLSFLVLVLRCFSGVDRVLIHRPIPLRVGSPSTSIVSMTSSKAIEKEFADAQPGPSKTSSPAHLLPSAERHA